MNSNQRLVKLPSSWTFLHLISDGCLHTRLSIHSILLLLILSFTLLTLLPYFHFFSPFPLSPPPTFPRPWLFNKEGLEWESASVSCSLHWATVSLRLETCWHTAALMHAVTSYRATPLVTHCDLFFSRLSLWLWPYPLNSAAFSYSWPFHFPASDAIRFVFSLFSPLSLLYLCWQTISVFTC